MKTLGCVLIFFCASCWCSAVSVVRPAILGNLAVFAAKEYFGYYVAPDATMEKCIVFLNKKGMRFSPLELMDPSRVVTKEDFARAAGQAKLLYLGEAELENGCIKKPLESESWIDYCLLNDIDLLPLWSRFVERTADGSLPEVKRFFKR